MILGLSKDAMSRIGITSSKNMSRPEQLAQITLASRTLKNHGYLS